jgi:hypothetical protein
MSTPLLALSEKPRVRERVYRNFNIESKARFTIKSWHIGNKFRDQHLESAIIAPICWGGGQRPLNKSKN